ncbi:MAG: RAD55 family ATPase, partial [Candidatus Nanohaloarchaea archaeon]
IINLDGKMQGGLVDGTMNLVTGKTGTGKTAFSACFLKQGIEEGEKGVYVTTEERKEDIQEDILAMFGWDFQDYEEEDNMRVMSIKPIFPSKEIENLNRLVRSYITDLLNQVKSAIEELDADRVVIDSVSIIEMFIRDEYMARVALSKLLNSLREEDVTAVLTGGIPETSEGLSGGGIIEYLVDTVILLEFVPVAEEHKRTLTIRKMRRTDHDVDIFPLEITSEGMKIQEVEGSSV